MFAKPLRNVRLMNLSSDVAPTKILLVDDDKGVRDEVAGYLERNGFTVDTAGDADSMDAAMSAQAYPVVVLDVMLPGEDGLSICRRLSRGAGPAIIMLSAMGSDIDRIVGLEIGADDYLAKPCNPRELLARVRAMLRRRGMQEEAPPDFDAHSGYEFGGFFLDTVRRRLRSPTGVISLVTPAEFALMTVFLEHPGEILTRDHLVELAHGPTSEVYDRSVDVQISRLRRKLSGGKSREIIRTYRSFGYMLDVAVKSV